MSPETSPTISVTGTSAHSLSYGEWSESVNFEVTNGNCKIRITSILNALGALDDLYGNLTITYVLEDERSGLASLKPLYSITGSGGTYVEMTEYTGGSSDGKDSLTTSATGITHTFDFNTVTALGIDFKGSVWVKLRAYDRTGFIGDIMESDIQLITVSNAPLAPVLSYPVNGWFDKNTTPYIVGTIPDPKAGNSDLHIKVQIAKDSSFSDVELTLESAIDNVGWEYDATGSGGWVDIPVSGIPVAATPALIGRSWKVTLQTEDELSTGQKYIKASCAGILI